MSSARQLGVALIFILTPPIFLLPQVMAHLRHLIAQVRRQLELAITDGAITGGARLFDALSQLDD